MPKKFKRNCNICGEYYVGQGRMFCSPKCQRIYQHGEHNPFYGKKHTKETIEFLSKRFWKTGIKAYRRIARENIKRECFMCKATDVKLVVHHLDENRHNNDLSNLRYVCYKCHCGKIHPSHMQKNKGKKFDEIFGEERAKDIRKRISISHIGRTPWNKGKHK